MRYEVAPTSRAIRVITICFFVVTIGFAIAGLRVPVMIVPVFVCALIGAFCYLTVPVAYEIEGDRLTVFTHLGCKNFGSISSCRRLERRISLLTLRVFGNGGVFGGTGYYWNSREGFFQAYVTTARWTDMVMVGTALRKVLLSPADPDAFVAACEASTTSAAAS
jgi:hypothetical protein